MQNIKDCKLYEIFFGITVYNTILTLVKKIYFKDYIKEIDTYNMIYLYGVFIFEILGIFGDNGFLNVITNLLLLYNFYYIYKEEKNLYKIVLILTQILICTISLLVFSKELFDISTKELLLFAVIIVMYISGLLNKRNAWKYLSCYVSTISMILLYIPAIIFSDSLILKGYMIIWIITIMNIINYIILNKHKTININFIAISLFITQIHTIVHFNIDINYFIYVPISIFTFSVMNLLKEKSSNFILQVYSNIMLGTGLLYLIIKDGDLFINNTIIFSLLMMIYLYGYIKNKKLCAYKVVAYIFFNILLLSIFNRLDLIQYERFIIMITTIVLTVLELCIKKINDEISDIYLLISYILAFILLNIEINIISFIFIIITSLMYKVYIDERKIDNIANIIPFIAIVPSVYISNEWAQIGNVNFSIFINFVLIFFTSILSIRDEKINIYTGISLAYIILQMIGLNINIYVNNHNILVNDVNEVKEFINLMDKIYKDNILPIDILNKFENKIYKLNFTILIIMIITCINLIIIIIRKRKEIKDYVSIPLIFSIFVLLFMVIYVKSSVDIDNLIIYNDSVTLLIKTLFNNMIIYLIMLAIICVEIVFLIEVLFRNKK